MLKAGGDECLKSLTNILNDILLKDRLPEEWMLNSLVPIFKGKGDQFNPNSYRGKKLLEHAFKLYKNILDRRLREVVDTDKYPIWNYARERECSCCICSEETKLFFVLVDLEKAFFDWVPREVICFALRQKIVPEYLVNGVLSSKKVVKMLSQLMGNYQVHFL